MTRGALEPGLTSSPRVAVVIPAYNAGALLHRALSSVLRQTLPDWECIVVDDGGDQDLSWVDSVDPRVRCQRQQNAGVSVARNQALLHTTAPLVAYIDQDDEWLPQKLERQVDELGDADFSYTAFLWVHADGREQPNAAHPIDYQQFLRDGHVCLSSLLVRRSALTRVGGFHPLLRVQQDHELLLRLLLTGARPHAVSEALTHCHLHGDNASGDYGRALWERLHVLQLHAEEARHREDMETLDAVRAGVSRSRSLYASQAFASFRDSRRPDHLVRAMNWSPAQTSSMLIRAALRRRGRS